MSERQAKKRAAGAETAPGKQDPPNTVRRAKWSVRAHLAPLEPWRLWPIAEVRADPNRQTWIIGLLFLHVVVVRAMAIVPSLA